VDKFCYLGDILSVDGNANAALEARIRIGWNKFRQLVQLLTSIDTTTTTIVLRLFWILSRATQVSWYQKAKTNLDLMEQEIASSSGICWAICKSAPHPRQITMPA